MNAFFLFILLVAAPVFSEGPQYSHKDTAVHQEFDNVYQDIRSLRRQSDGFLAKCTSLPANVTGDGTVYTVDYGSVTYNLRGSYSASSNIFTVRYPGIYSCSASLHTDGNTSGGGFGSGLLTISVNGGSKKYERGWVVASGIGGINADRVPYLVSVPSLYLNANDTVVVNLTVAGGAKTIDIVNVDQNWFGCALVN